MKTLLITVALLFGACNIATAGFVDLFNGVKVGGQLPESDLKYLAKTPDKNANLTLIDFWATWCVPCRESIPMLNALHAKFATEGFEVIGITKESEEVVAPFLEKMPILYPYAVEGAKSLHKALGIKALPYAIFVNKSGKILWRGQPSEITESLVQSLLANSGG
ncbi:thiol-disulfide isomerase/thioredoxin [Undibacterium sp. GrIS 1.2]|uniref:TlpA family protein disulfide reductase n=1 Tax=Undibacterium sp. GrIS 1.2 TaxID=3143933 RepID=UPI003399DFEE